MKRTIPLIAFSTTFLAGSMLLPASIIFTHELPGVQQTTVTGATTESFNSLPAGAFGPYVSTVGAYSSGGAIVNPDAFGGANQTRYIAAGVQSGALQYNLAFTGLRTYFGFYWSAGDDQNRIDFFDGATLQGTFAVGDIIPTLTSAYFGNPNTGQNPAQPYVYLNFTSTDLASRFDRVVFSNATLGGGYETDNHSVFDQIIAPPGVPSSPTTGVPEPASIALVGCGLACASFLARLRRLRSAKRSIGRSLG